MCFTEVISAQEALFTVAAVEPIFLTGGEKPYVYDLGNLGFWSHPLFTSFSNRLSSSGKLLKLESFQMLHDDISRAVPVQLMLVFSGRTSHTESVHPIGRLRARRMDRTAVGAPRASGRPRSVQIRRRNFQDEAQKKERRVSERERSGCHSCAEDPSAVARREPQEGKLSGCA